jgi:S1-C subfamily serine protease
MLLAAAALLFSPLASHAAENGWFGFALPASPAAKAGLSAGDMIVEIEGIVVEGAKADTLKAAMQKSAGETLRLKIKRGADASQDVSLIAGPKPPS